MEEIQIQINNYIFNIVLTNTHREEVVNVSSKIKELPGLDETTQNLTQHLILIKYMVKSMKDENNNHFRLEFDKDSSLSLESVRDLLSLAEDPAQQDTLAKLYLILIQVLAGSNGRSFIDQHGNALAGVKIIESNRNPTFH